MRYYKIYVDNTKGLYTYSDRDNKFEIGERVFVSFRGHRKTGLIIGRDSDQPKEFKVLEIEKKVENSLKLSEEYIKLLVWVKQYYMSSYEQVLGAAIPNGLSTKYEKYYTLISFDKMFKDNELCKEIQDFFYDRMKVTKGTLTKNFGKDLINEMIKSGSLFKDRNNIFLNRMIDEYQESYQEVVKYYNNRLKVGEKTLKDKFEPKYIEQLLKKGYIGYGKEIVKRNRIQLEDVSEEISIKNRILNEEQDDAKNKILKESDFFYLLKGITGSGKTEVYISIIKEGFKNGKGSIFLVPEISLTPQMIDRFKGEFKENIAILHSKLTAKERAEEWLNIYSGNKKIVLGVRSAIFAPVKDLGYIILDEEHETTYKQDSNPRYNAKQVAIMRGIYEKAKIILGSATPSIESFYYAQMNKFKLIELKKRYNDAKVPEIELIDMTQEEDIYFSKKLLSEIKAALLREEQVLLLLNRKGYSTYIQCADCGHVEECPHCSIKYSYYASQGVLKCNYCGKVIKYTGHCRKCGSKNLVHSGKGVERVEEEIKKYFDVRVIRVDSEVSRDRDFFDRVYYDFLDKKYDIMIGTQLISKGLHFPNVTLVGVINADTILNFPDFRAGEKTFQLMLQVAGRAGREEKKGKVLIQTYQKENTIFKKIVANEYEGFYKYEIENRELLQYPPFGKIINIGLSSKYEKYLEKFVVDFYENVKYDKVEMYGPMKSLVYKVKDRYRYNIFVKGNKNGINEFKKFLKRALQKYDSEKKVRIVVDIDPINLI